MLGRQQIQSTFATSGRILVKPTLAQKQTHPISNCLPSKQFAAL